MRILALTIFAVGIGIATAPARAQTYDPNYPVCLHVYGPITYYECAYTSLAQCNATASGRAAQCIVNPMYRAQGAYGPPLRYRRYPYAY